jgi:hypothetical protein
MMPSKLNQELFDHQEDTFVLTFYDGNKKAVNSKRFRPGGYGDALVWANRHYYEGFGWTLEVQTLAVNNNTVKVLHADGEVR